MEITSDDFIIPKKRKNNYDILKNIIQPENNEKKSNLGNFNISPNIIKTNNIIEKSTNEINVEIENNINDRMDDNDILIQSNSSKSNDSNSLINSHETNETNEINESNESGDGTREIYERIPFLQMCWSLKDYHRPETGFYLKEELGDILKIFNDLPFYYDLVDTNIWEWFSRLCFIISFLYVQTKSKNIIPLNLENLLLPWRNFIKIFVEISKKEWNEMIEHKIHWISEIKNYDPIENEICLPVLWISKNEGEECYGGIGLEQFSILIFKHIEKLGKENNIKWIYESKDRVSQYFITSCFNLQ